MNSSCSEIKLYEDRDPSLFLSYVNCRTQNDITYMTNISSFISDLWSFDVAQIMTTTFPQEKSSGKTLRTHISSDQINPSIVLSLPDTPKVLSPTTSAGTAFFPFIEVLHGVSRIRE
jgi:hypothetical protein